MFLYLINLKTINDSMGHNAGDEYLISFANLLKVVANEDVKVFRLGGDEFILLAKNHTHQQVVKLVETIIQKSKKPVTILNKKITLSFAIGISLFPKHGKNIKKLLILADQAMYKNKQNKFQKVNSYNFA